MRDIPIVDAHIHLWDLKRIAYPWLTPPFGEGVTGNVEPIARDYLLDDYLADAAGWNVQGTVHIDAGAAPHEAVNETAWLQSVADARGFPQAIVAYAALEGPDAERVLAAQSEFANLRGIRQILNWHPDPTKTYTPRDLLEDDAWLQGFARLGRHALSFDLQIYPNQMPAAARLAAQHPDTPIILNHAGMPVDRDEAGLNAWREGMASLARQPNVSVKISGLGIVDHHWTVESIRPFVLETIDLFGTDRCMFASDFPTDKLFSSFDAVFDAFDLITRGFSGAERRKLFGETAARIYRIEGSRRPA